MPDRHGEGSAARTTTTGEEEEIGAIQDKKKEHNNLCNPSQAAYQSEPFVVVGSERWLPVAARRRNDDDLVETDAHGHKTYFN